MSTSNATPRIAIKTKSGNVAIAYRTTGVPGLVVHRTFGGKGWAITHRPSGCLVTSQPFATRAYATTIARRLNGLTDWLALDTTDLPAMKDLGRRVMAAINPSLYVGQVSGPTRSSIVESILPAGWELQGDDLDGLLVCPCGHTIEMDGSCPTGCVSPLRTAGLI